MKHVIDSRIEGGGESIVQGVHLWHLSERGETSKVKEK